MLAKRPIKDVCIYVLKDPETKEIRYVGKTKGSLEERLRGHLKDKTKDYRGYWIQSLKTKDLSPIIESIEKVSDETWQERETFWIQHYKELGARLTNGNSGGLGGHNPTAEVRAKISTAKKGKTKSPETRAKMSAANKNRSPEIRAKMAAANKGKTRSPETRAKMSAAHKGKVLSAEAIAKRTATRKGKKQSAETRAKISTANKGKTHSAETRAKISTAMKANREKKNKIPFNQRKSLIVDNSNLAF